jgi:hypothetical protein
MKRTFVIDLLPEMSTEKLEKCTKVTLKVVFSRNLRDSSPVIHLLVNEARTNQRREFQEASSSVFETDQIFFIPNSAVVLSRVQCWTSV